jgi:hypothetical protein
MRAAGSSRSPRSRELAVRGPAFTVTTGAGIRAAKSPSGSGGEGWRAGSEEVEEGDRSAVFASSGKQLVGGVFGTGEGGRVGELAWIPRQKILRRGIQASEVESH